MSASTIHPRWERATFGIAIDGRRAPIYGWVWRTWGVHKNRGSAFVVTHISSGLRLTEFARLREALRFCECANDLTDWSAAAIEGPENVALALHRLALRLTGSRPDLRLVNPLGGGAT